MSKVYVIKDGELYHAYRDHVIKKAVEQPYPFANAALQQAIIRYIRATHRLDESVPVRVYNIKRDGGWIEYQCTFELGGKKHAYGTRVTSSYLRQYSK